MIEETVILNEIYSHSFIIYGASSQRIHERVIDDRIPRGTCSSLVPNVAFKSEI